MPAQRERKLRPWERVLERAAASRPGGWFFVHLASHIDPFLLRLSGGRISSGIGQQVLLLTTKGARSGKSRSTPLVYLKDRNDLVLIASRAGDSRHPAWYHNLKAHPEVEVLVTCGSGTYIAREAEGPERQRLWAKAVDYYAGYEIYQERADQRRIPVVVLTPGP